MSITERTKMQAYSVEMRCGMPGCEGYMVPTGMCLTMLPPLYPHQCSVCGHAENYQKTYPAIEFEVIKVAGV